MLSSTLHRLCPIVVALLTLLAGCAGGNNTVFEEVVEKIYTVEPNADVSIQNHDGAVQVYGSDANEIRVQCVKKAYSHERLNQIAVDVTTKPGGVSIITKFPPPPRWLFSDHSGTVECTVVIPATASISAIELNAGEVLLESMRGSEVRARIHDGRIFVRNCFTNLKLAVNRGALTVSYEWWEEKKVFGADDHETGKRMDLVAQ